MQHNDVDVVAQQSILSLVASIIIASVPQFIDPSIESFQVCRVKALALGLSR